MKFLGIDTSNYTTSAALYDTESSSIITAGKLLPVKKGEAGLRQSDAVFHHTKQLPEVVERVFSEMNGIPDGIGVSVRPRNVEGSYMPCRRYAGSPFTKLPTKRDTFLRRFIRRESLILRRIVS